MVTDKDMLRHGVSRRQRTPGGLRATGEGFNLARHFSVPTHQASPITFSQAYTLHQPFKMLLGGFPTALKRILGRKEQHTPYTSLLNRSEELDSEDGLLKEEEAYTDGQSSASEDVGARVPPPNFQTTSRSLTYMNLLLFIVSMIAFASTFLAKDYVPNVEERNYFLKQTSERCKNQSTPVD
jgi:hypothetical protein